MSRHEDFGRVYQEHAALVAAIAFRVIGSRTAAEDITHDVFLAYWSAPDLYDAGRGTVRALLCSITYHRSIDWLRAHLSRERRELRWSPREPSEGPEAEVVRRAAGRDVRAAVAALPPPQRHAIELVFYEGLTHAATAAELGIPLGTAKTRIRTALHQLATVLAAGDGSASGPSM